jgi:CPA2 family monovalent cation:H+ antiporter-2
LSVQERNPAVDGHSELALIQGVATMLVYACIGGFVALRLHLTPIVGFLAAGVLLGPFTPGPIANDDVAHQLAELGVILLMFGVGLHFSVRDLMAVRAIAVPGAVGQSLIAVALTAGIAMTWGWSLRAGVVLGIAVSVASTVVLIRALAERHVLDSQAGRTAVGWLVVEDLMSVLVLVLLPLLAAGQDHGNELIVGAERAIEGPGENVLLSLALTFGKLAVLIFLVFVVGQRLVSWALAQLGSSESEEMFTLTVLVIALGVAVGANVAFDVSFALGAFFAGVIVGGSGVEHRAATDVLPLRDIFGVLFFVSVGMLFDPGVLVRAPGQLLAVVLLIMIAKPLAAGLIALALRQPLRVVLTVSPALAQIGEFSFIVAVMGREVGILPAGATQLIVGGAIVSIALNPFLMRAADWFGGRFAEQAVTQAEPRTIHP